MGQRYEIVVRGHLPSQWAAAFEGMAVQCQADGSSCIAGSLPDQSALYGLLMRLRDLGLTLVSMRQLPEEK
jgi:hypothetical protein